MNSFDDLPADLQQAPSAREIWNECAELAVFLIEKNKAYGDSALKPLRVMSKADPAEQIRVRMDDKLSRLLRGEAAGEDAVRDLFGYYVLLRICERQVTTTTSLAQLEMLRQFKVLNEDQRDTLLGFFGLEVLKKRSVEQQAADLFEAVATTNRFGELWDMIQACPPDQYPSSFTRNPFKRDGMGPPR